MARRKKRSRTTVDRGVQSTVQSASSTNPSNADVNSTADTTPVSSTKSWSAYFFEAGLLGGLPVERLKPWKSPARKSLRQNFARLAPTEYIAPFDLKSKIRDSKRAQPTEANFPDFEDKNESTLTPITDISCIIRDNTGIPGTPGEPLVVKISAMPLLNDKSSFAIPSTLTLSLLYSTLTYVASCNNSSIVQDPIRHGSDRKMRQGGPVPRPPSDHGNCHHIHAQHCARNDNDIHNIQLFRGPAGTWDSRTTAQSLNNFLQDLLPLTQLLEVIFKSVLLGCWEKYDKVRRKMPSGLGGLGDCFGLWRSRAIVVDSMTNLHRDLKDVCYGWCAIVPLGNFKGGDVCLPELGYRIPLPVGSVLFLRSHIIPHYVGHWSGHRFSIIHFSHQSTFDYYTQESNEERLHDFKDMPGWWRSNR